MTPTEKPALNIPSAPQYILDNFDNTDRIVVLVLNREFCETIQPLSLFELQAWLGHSSPHSTQPMRESAPGNSRAPVPTQPTSSGTCAPLKC